MKFATSLSRLKDYARERCGTLEQLSDDTYIIKLPGLNGSVEILFFEEVTQ